MNLQLFGIIGKPVLHSLSPRMWNAAFRELKINAKYLYVPVDSANEGIEVMKRVGLAGINVTAPFKEDILAQVDELSGTANRIGAVNTIANKNGRLWATNTDYNGITEVVRSLSLSSKKALVLGTGGAARAVMYVLEDMDFRVILIGRNKEKLQAFQQEFNCDTADFTHFKKLLNDCSFIVSTLPEPTEYLNRSTLTSNHILFDANYKNDALDKLSKQIGFSYVSGLEWLVRQAKPAFSLLSGRDVSAESLKSYLQVAQPENSTSIALIGLAGVGKSTVGRTLAQALNYSFVDIDEEVEKVAGKSIRQIFDEYGEEWFREREYEVLAQKAGEEKIIISCGGGIVTKKKSREVIQNQSLCVWLDASVDYCMDGLDTSNRPLYASGNPVGIAKEVYAQRKSLFADAAHVLMNVEGKNAEQIVAALSNEFKEK